MFLLALLFLGASTSLLDKVATDCLSKLDLNEFKNLYHEIQFWQTWAAMEFVPLLVKSEHVSEATKARATEDATKKWTQFNPDTHLNVPAYFKDTVYFQDTDYWDPHNLRIIWDDRQWLALSYIELYRQFGGHS